MSCLQGPLCFPGPAAGPVASPEGGRRPTGPDGEGEHARDRSEDARGWPPTGSRAELRLTDPCGEVPTGPCRLSPQPHLQGGRRGKKALEC